MNDIPTYPPPLTCCGGMYAHRKDCPRSSKPDPYEREAYLSLADEFDPIGRTGPAPSLADFDEDAIAAARRFARRYSLPFPMTHGIDLAMAYVASAERREASGA